MYGCKHLFKIDRWGNKKNTNKKAKIYDGSQATDKKQQGMTHISLIASFSC